MREKKKTAIIACGVMEWNLRRVMTRLPEREFVLRVMPAQLHQNPLKLRELLQNEINDLSARGDLCGITLAYGVCGRGTMGLRAESVPLVLPRAQDCIGLFLGSHQRYQEQFEAHPGTRYLTQGWYEKTHRHRDDATQNYQSKRNESLYSVTHDELAKQYGEDNADFICTFRESWKHNYDRAAYIQFDGEKMPPPGRLVTEGLAESLNWEHTVLEGDESLLFAMLNGDWSDPRLLVIPPGNKTVPAPGADVVGYASSADSAVDNVLQRYEDRSSDTPPKREGLGLGIDTGGTFTDSVIFDFSEDKVVASAKAPTTHGDLLAGIRGVLAKLPADKLRNVSRVGLSTTLATNAFVEHKGRPVALLAMSPFHLSTDDLPFTFVHHIAGALDMEGIEQEALDPGEIVRCACEAREAGCEAVAISGFASVINPVHEQAVAALVLEETGMHAVCGHELTSRLNFKDRAVTAAMNARLIPMIEELIDAVDDALAEVGLENARVMLVKGDGSQILAEAARKVPVETVLSGPAASVVGAARIFGNRDAIVADMGGTTLDVAELRGGSPVLSETGSRIADFQTSVRAMALQTIGLGGDSEINLAGWPKVRIGPRRVIPLCRLAERFPNAVDDYTDTLAEIVCHDVNAADIVALAPGVDPGDNRLLLHLATGPQPLALLARKLNRAQPRHIPWEEHETAGRLVRYGLTLTDVLHVQGKLDLFDRRPSDKLVSCWAMLLETDPATIIADILHEFRRMVCQTVLRVSLPEACPREGNEELFGWLTQHLTADDQEPDRTTFTMRLPFPLIGVGAPAGALFPCLAEIFGQEILVSEHSPVANAIGAIAGDVLLREQAVIRLPDSGAFLCSWRGGTHRAATLEEALETCESALEKLLRKEAAANEIPYTAPRFNAVNQQARCRDGTLFLGLTLHAELRG
ncbi:MAG: DUF1638 domain-containing protein [Lentisphaeria bacterium]|nr:DUF1638 domain-containing protein [Lentisphaeria bacterium]